MRDQRLSRCARTTTSIRSPGQRASAAAEAEPDLAPTGSETILAVEDDADVRKLAAENLRGLGYKVLEAANGPDALRILRQEPSVDLLFTDMILPGGMTGRNIADEALKFQPDLKVLYASGYTGDAIVHQGRLEPGVNLLPKPYRRAQLGRMVRKALDRVD